MSCNVERKDAIYNEVAKNIWLNFSVKNMCNFLSGCQTVTCIDVGNKIVVFDRVYLLHQKDVAY